MRRDDVCLGGWIVHSIRNGLVSSEHAVGAPCGRRGSALVLASSGPPIFERVIAAYGTVAGQDKIGLFLVAACSDRDSAGWRPRLRADIAELYQARDAVAGAGPWCCSAALAWLPGCGCAAPSTICSDFARLISGCYDCLQLSPSSSHFCGGACGTREIPEGPPDSTWYSTYASDYSLI
jgi:hypothetical protein